MSKRARKRDKNFVAISFEGQLALGTLSNAIVISGGIFGAVFGEDIFVVSADLLFTLRDLTGGEGPIKVGLAHSDLSVTEINEAITVELTDPDDIITKERLSRPVRTVGIFTSDTAASGGQTNRLEDGTKIRQKLMFSIGDGFTLDMWAKNQSGATLTTGAIV